MTLSSSLLSAVPISSHFGNGGGDFAFSSCLPKTSTLGSSLSAGRSHAAWLAGRSDEISYHLACVSGLAVHWTNFHAASRFLLDLNTAQLEPPTKDVLVSLVGIGATAHFLSKPAPPASLIRPMCQGPEKNIGWVPRTKAGVMSKPCLVVFGLRPSSAKDL